MIKLVKSPKKNKTRNIGKEYSSDSKDFIKKLTIVLCVVLGVGLLGTVIFINYKYTITTVYVEGNQHYSDDEIKEIVMGKGLGNNSIYLSLKYKKKGVKDIPFVEAMDVKIISPDTIKITVYEKALAGYVEYLGRYLYFDRDGIIVESSDMKTASVPQVTGLSFDYIVLHEKLPISNDKIFEQVLNVTQLLTKYEILVDKIYFDHTYEMTLFFGDARVMVGSEEYLEEKIMKLRAFLPELEGKKGKLRMENYTDGMKNITFELDK